VAGTSQRATPHDQRTGSGGADEAGAGAALDDLAAVTPAAQV
jgi:hypothetical protein